MASAPMAFGEENLLASVNQYRQVQRDLDQALAKRTSPEQSAIQRLLDGIYFIDFGHAAPELMELFLGNRPLSQTQFQNLYDSPSEPAFSSYRQARAYLSRLPEPLSFESVRRLHMVAVPWENSSGLGPGTIRQKFVYGPEFEHGLHPLQIKAINENPYLYFMEGTSIYADVPQGVDQAANGERIRGAIVYPRPRDIKHATLMRLQASNPQLVQKVLKYQAEHGSEFSNQSEALTQELVAALLKERIDTFEKEAAALGELTTSAKIERYIQLIARFQKDYVSIHPFPDGNGRTSRLLLNYLAERAGLPAPRLAYPNEDLFWTTAMWEQQVREGILASLRLKQDFLKRMQSRQPVEKSVALFAPVLPEGDLQAYESYVRNRFQSEFSIKQELLRDPVGTIRKLKTDYKIPGHSCDRIYRAG
jgi:hypothetical protein